MTTKRPWNRSGPETRGLGQSGQLWQANSQTQHAKTDPLPQIPHFPALDDKTFLICIGAAKCATSWLYRYLGGLPGAVTSPLKEVHFFNARYNEYALGDVDALALTRLRFHLDQPGDALENLRSRDSFQASVDRVQMIYDDAAYLAHFARMSDGTTRTFCDLTPAYSTIGTKGFAFLRDVFANQNIRLRVLFLMRDPVERFWSQLCHLQQMTPNQEVIGNWQSVMHAPALTARADYRATIAALEATIPSQDVLFLFYEQLFEPDSLRKLCEFAGLPYRPADPARRENETKAKAVLPPEAAAALHQHLQMQYAMCRDRFGVRVPTSWRA